MMHLVVALLATAGSHVPKIAVLDMLDLSGEQSTLVRQLTQVMVTEVSTHSDLKVISSAEISQVLSYEKQKELLGCKDDSCVTEIAGALGVDYLLMGQLGKLGSRYRIDIRITEAQHVSLVGSVGDFVSNNVDDVADATVKMTRQVLVEAKLAKGMNANLVPPPTVAALTTIPAVAASSDAAPSHTAAYATWGVAGGLLVAAVVMTVVTVTTFNSASDPKNTTTYLTEAQSLNWKGPLADGLWAGALLAGGAGTYLYFSASPATPGAGGEVAVGGRF